MNSILFQSFCVPGGHSVSKDVRTAGDVGQAREAAADGPNCCAVQIHRPVRCSLLQSLLIVTSPRDDAIHLTKLN